MFYYFLTPPSFYFVTFFSTFSLRYRVFLCYRIIFTLRDIFFRLCEWRNKSECVDSDVVSNILNSRGNRSFFNKKKKEKLKRYLWGRTNCMYGWVFLSFVHNNQIDMRTLLSKVINLIKRKCFVFICTYGFFNLKCLKKASNSEAPVRSRLQFSPFLSGAWRMI